MTLSSTTVWMVIVVLAAGTFALRFSFLGMIGGRQIPGWALRLLRYTPVAVIPGLMAPQIARPMAETGLPDPTLLGAVAVTLLVGIWRRNAIWAMLSGALVLGALTLLRVALAP
ncbi:MAG: AzlD domain-containing protein [Rhodobacter sp.]|uniref:AzlD domain-containing protein n=1 Tax=Pararhodobacter sp. TaxID=2127056 RepID=UPI001D4AE129|nr:AzlD domain-containing protein [Pararhodobacter sp.]MCB1346120.1 AzlD domain-containing protein [Paracoccaceae bacterium]MCC0074882.1 AzlD domain-containing protein [Rhodobacter sp.]HPD90882.1 AzlD domain-containing protein [Pararhodobacter sp.]